MQILSVAVSKKKVFRTICIYVLMLLGVFFLIGFTDWKSSYIGLIGLPCSILITIYLVKLCLQTLKRDELLRLDNSGIHVNIPLYFKKTILWSEIKGVEIDEREIRPQLRLLVDDPSLYMTKSLRLLYKLSGNGDKLVFNGDLLDKTLYQIETYVRLKLNEIGYQQENKINTIKSVILTKEESYLGYIFIALIVIFPLLIYTNPDKKSFGLFIASPSRVSSIADSADKAESLKIYMTSLALLTDVQSQIDERNIITNNHLIFSTFTFPFKIAENPLLKEPFMADAEKSLGFNTTYLGIFGRFIQISQEPLVESINVVNSEEAISNNLD